MGALCSSPQAESPDSEPETIFESAADPKPAHKTSETLDADGKPGGLDLQASSKHRSEAQRTVTTERMMLPSVQLQMRGASSSDPMEDGFITNAQLLVCSPPGHTISITARRDDDGDVGIAILEAGTFPMNDPTEVLVAPEMAKGDARLEHVCPGIQGFVIIIIAPGGIADVEIRGMSGPIFSIIHPEPLK
eukprot:gnl/Dysnectes_brevis/668_a736_5250.p1 GENE.gnl/Dysnectes_brevis/668_a736_5250~~gnl/Dysnectes_brevis/668_a736_5250.p1  ORF type:complete len:191 (-),score=43.27 gnl/Dysnectes_brevis/668_a736_5250:88-660(-)